MSNFEDFPTSTPDTDDVLILLEHDSTDERIIQVAEIIQAKTATTQESIVTQAEQLQADTVRKTEKVKSAASAERSDVERERARLHEEVNQKCNALLSDINHQESENLEQIDTEQVNGDILLAACNRVSKANEQEALVCREEHSELMLNIQAATKALVAICNEVNQLEEKRLNDTINRENLISDRNADEQIAQLNRGRLRKLMRSSTEVDETHFFQEEGAFSAPIASVDDINARFGEFEQGQYSYRQEHTVLIQEITSIQKEIDRINTENDSRKEQIDSLLRELAILEQTDQSLRLKIEELENMLIGYKKIKNEIDATIQSLDEHETMLQVILDEGTDALETLPPEFKEIVMEAINIEKQQADLATSTDLTTVLPDFGSDTVRIAVSTPGLTNTTDVARVSSPKPEEIKLPTNAYASQASTKAVEMKELVRAAVTTGSLLRPTAVALAQGALRSGMRAEIIVKSQV